MSYNTLARDIKTYFSHAVFPLRASNLEEEITDDIRSNYSKPILKFDLNKGIKYLWDKDYIDGLVVKNRKSKSIRQDRMDENYMYKKSYPTDWKALMGMPIQKSKFKVIKKGGLNHFESNPSIGFIGVTIHSDSANDVDNLITLILKHNK